MSDDEHFSLHSFDPDNNIDNEIDQFYQKLSLQFYGEDKQEKVSSLISGSTQETSKPSRDTLPEVKKGFKYVTPLSTRPGSPRAGQIQVEKGLRNPNSARSPSKRRLPQSNKLLQLLKSPYNQKNTQKQAFIKKQMDMIRRIQIQELKEHYYK
ncbi:unnamed protein product (macronuclear) [Paramecium tetraurelia]|uniref:Uncharacterized protein n=1 Tax=Paramecium tetraurelia TaxID=5888 RepID=A0C640_PARTE|nr:uncharacterized protein GSPATT00035386001 [Paramecium tetraurelia]CAK66257.1 unnamed protein product [Paramecium tetraurelia]|eukprot:XP_001433654.1 hypothetical protein (macronuclear) [Paramecium tetraurelia strain d4-2]